jgi:beta-galactosidase
VLEGLPSGVEAVHRGDLLFLLNHGRAPAGVKLPGRHLDLLTGAESDGGVELDRYGVAVLRDVPA